MTKKEKELMESIRRQADVIMAKSKEIDSLTEQLKTTNDKSNANLGKHLRLKEQLYHNLSQEYLELDARLYRLHNRIIAIGFQPPKLSVKLA